VVVKSGKKDSEKLRFDIGSPYDKLKMPKFHLTDREAQALVTFVTSVRKSLVDDSLKQVAGPVGNNAILGRQVATMYNCYGCHNIDGNQPPIYRSLGALFPNGSLDPSKIDIGAPRLLGQGAKTKPQWLVFFLQNVHKLRPTRADNPLVKLELRMPSFPIDVDQASRLADYFASWSKENSGELAQLLEPIEKHRKLRLAQQEQHQQTINRLISRSEDPSIGKNEKKRIEDRIKVLSSGSGPKIPAWYDSESEKVQGSAQKLMDFVYRQYGQLKKKKVDVFTEPLDVDDANDWQIDRVANWEQVRTTSSFLRDLFDVPYPFPPGKQPNIDHERFVRGQALFKEMKCAQCHSLGNEDKLLALWKMDNPSGTAPAPAAAPADDEGGFFDEPEDKPKAAAAPAKLGPAYTAPNLKHVSKRLQWSWVDRWLQGTTTIVPAAKMPVQFPGGGTFFFQYPPDKKKQMHALFGASGKEQRKLVMDFIYTASASNFTPRADSLPAQPLAKVELLPLQISKRHIAPGFGALAIQAPAKAVNTTQVVGPTVVKKTSDIVLHDGTTEWKDQAGTGRVVGVVKWTGKSPGRTPYSMSAKPYCNKLNSPPKFIETYAVNKDKSVKNVLIHVTKGSVMSRKYSAPKTAALLDQVGCVYVPHVKAIMARQTLIARNNDDTAHNVKALGENKSQPVKGAQDSFKINKFSLNNLFECSVHPWMKARLHVLEHPFFFVSDVQGRFEIKGLPPGKYTFQAFHETANDARGAVKTVEFEVEIKADTSLRQDVSVQMSK
jgi:hypothetical protein